MEEVKYTLSFLNGADIIKKADVSTAKWKPAGLFIKFKDGKEKTITHGVIIEVMSRAIIGNAIAKNMGITE